MRQSELQVIVEKELRSSLKSSGPDLSPFMVSCGVQKILE